MPDSNYNDYSMPSSRPPEPPFRSQYSGRDISQADTRGIDARADIPAAENYQPGSSRLDTESFEPSRSGTTDTMPRAVAYEHNSRTHARPSSAGHAAAPAKSGAGKTFLMGFLGALLACALVFGGFFAFGGFSNFKAKETSALTGSTDPSVINAVDEGQTLAEAVAAKALPSVVGVYNYRQQSAYSPYGYGYGSGYGNGTSNTGELVATGMGSGVIISTDGYIITNYHVVEGADKITVTVDGKERDATYVGGDQSSDIAVVKVDDTSGLVAADIGDSDSLAIGEWVMTIGAPLGLEQSVATGVVSATNRSTIMNNSSSGEYYYTNATPSYTYYPNMIQTDAVINPGNSGGALVDSDGKLVGINSMLSSSSGNYAGVGFAIPINYARGIAEDIIAGKEPTHSALGVSISQVNSQTAKRYNLSATSGAYVANIYDGTGAAESDLKVGDIITAIDGKKVTSTTDVTLDVRAHPVGDTVTVTVNRDGESIDIPVVLTSDEKIASQADTEEQQQSPYGNGYGQGQGQGYGQGQGQGRGYTDEELEELLRMFGF